MDYMKKMAYEVFPWANIDKALTMPGLIQLRWGKERAAWGRVLGGTDEQLALFIDEKIPLAPVNFGVLEHASYSMALYLVPHIERVIEKGITREETWAWYAAYRAALKENTKPVAD